MRVHLALAGLVVPVACTLRPGDVGRRRAADVPEPSSDDHLGRRPRDGDFGR